MGVSAGFSGFRSALFCCAEKIKYTPFPYLRFINDPCIQRYMPLDDFQRFGEKLQKELDLIADDGPYTDRDLPHVKRYVAKMDKKVTESSLQLYLRNIRKTAERLDQPIVDLTEADLDAHVYDLRHNDSYGRGGGGLSDHTISNIENALSRFLKLTHDGEDDHWIEDYDFTQTGESKIEPGDMLSPSDIQALTTHANNMRDIAMIEFLADTGARLTLVMTLRVGDVDLDDDKPTYIPNSNASGLKGAEIQRYPIIDSKSVLRTYLRTVHPRPDRDDVALFHKIPGHGNDYDGGDGSITPSVVRGQLRKAADRAGLDKPVNPHNFRHSAVTRMAREGFTRSQIEHRVHWTIDTDQWATYEHIAGEQHNDDIFVAAGVIDDDSEGPSRERLPCGNCREPLAPHHEYCPRCGEPATQEARNLKTTGQDALMSALAQIGDAERRQFIAEVARISRENPERLEAHEDPSED